MPAAIGLLHGGALIYINSAFAYAFGYRSASELMEAGGLDAILPGGASLLQCEADDGRIDALTRSRRRLKVAFALSTLDAEADTTLLRLIDQGTFETEPLSPPEAEARCPAPEPVAEAAPQASFDAEAATRRLDFLAKVSHEVRTPLNSIIGFTELMLQERFGPIGNARYKGYAEDIHQSGLYALSLLNDLLDISKIEAGKFELDFTAVDVAEVVEACVASLQPLAKRTRIVLRTSLADDLPVVVADPRRLKQILLNLLTNAIKFTQEGGQVIVSGTMTGGELRLRVRDSGVGMSKNEIAYAMQPFHQLDTAPRRQSGTGLGLPLTKALADANRARLELTSEPGVGTAADVIFPAERLFRA
jgi:signal transduction histidine kinase